MIKITSYKQEDHNVSIIIVDSPAKSGMYITYHENDKMEGTIHFPKQFIPAGKKIEEMDLNEILNLVA